MKKHERTLIKFGTGNFPALREQLLADLSREYFAVLLAKTEQADGVRVINVIESRVFNSDDLHDQKEMSLRIRKKSVFDILMDIEERVDVDTLIDVHTHPFSRKSVAFSGIDNDDETRFARFLADFFPKISYGSIVLSQEEYTARVWSCEEEKSTSFPAEITTAFAPERILRSGQERNLSIWKESELFDGDNALFNRSMLALGLDAMRRIVDRQIVTVVGSGGLGAIIAENLIHYGFQELHLIDNDTLSVSNLNRIVGATFCDATAGRLKVETLKKHLEAINPDATVIPHALDITVPDPEMEALFATSDWVIAATDNHTSRFAVQSMCLKYFTPFISAGVNITVNTEQRNIEDMSGEVITVRPGDNLCLSCLGRLNPNRIAAESHPEGAVRSGMVEKGYVSGLTVREPAVKTLNSIVAAIATDVLVNHYTEYQKHEPVWVYENNAGKSIYPDHESVLNRASECFCHKF